MGINADFAAFKNPPFRIAEQGWGEFDMQITLTAADKDHIVTHDLNFAQNRYESKHVIVCCTYNAYNPTMQNGGLTKVDV